MALLNPKALTKKKKVSTAPTTDPLDKVRALAASGSAVAQKYLSIYGGNMPAQQSGAAGRGDYGAEDVAALQAQSARGGAMSTAEQATGTLEYKKALKTTSKYLPSGGLRAPTPASIVSSGRYAPRTVAGKTANSAGAYYGKAGNGNMDTSYDSAGNPVNGRAILGGSTVVDRSAGVPKNPLDAYMQALSPDSVLDRQKQARRELERERQSQMDAIRQKYKSQVANEQQAGAEDLARQRSMNLRAGLGGSDFGAANKAEVRNRTNANVRAIEANQDIEVGNAMNQIEQLAQARVQQEQDALQQGFSNMFQYQQYNQQQQQQMRAQAVESIAQLGKSGLDIATIKQRDPQLYESLLSTSNMGDVELEAVLNNNKPAPSKIDYQTIVRGGKIMMFGVDPATGTMKMLEQDVDMPDNYKTLQADDGTILGIPEDWDGDTSKIVTVGNYRKLLASELGGGGGVSVGSLTPLAQSIYDNPALLNNLTPTEKGKVLKELAGQGLDLANFATEKVTAAQREQIAGFDDLIREANNAADLLENTKLNVGPIASRGKAIGAAFGFQQDYTSYRSIIDNFGSALLKLRSGAAVTPQEFTRIAGFIPATTDDERTAQTKINRFIEEMTKAQQNYVMRSTQTTQQIQNSVMPKSGSILTSPDGAQQVDTADLSPEQIQEARNAGWS